MNTNNTSSYQPTNETHYTQENTTITKHKRSQQLVLTHHYEPKNYIYANPSIFTERYDECGNQHHSRERLMMGIIMPETC